LQEGFTMRLIQVLGTGCPKCEKLKKNAEEAARLAGVEATVEKITDIGQITSFGVMMTPALAIDGEVKAVGKVLSADEIKAFLQ
jgi:small redox-active disulfide protein 2